MGRKKIPFSDEELAQEMKDYTPEMYRRRDIKGLIVVVFTIMVQVFVSGVGGAYASDPTLVFFFAGLWFFAVVELGMVLLSLLYNRGGNFEKSYKLFLTRRIRRKKRSLETELAKVIHS